MNEEKRTGDVPIPDNLEELLNKEQRQALPGLEYSGWEPCFSRKKTFLEPEIVMRNRHDNRLGILEYDGSIRIQGDIDVRDEDAQIQSTSSNNTPIWKK